VTSYLGVDLGTTAVKAVVLAPDGTVLARSRAPHPHARAVGRGRVNPTAWISSIEAACRALGPAASTVSGVGLSVHSPSALLYDRAGVALADGITWDHPGLPAVVAELAALRTDDEAVLAGNRPFPATMMAAAYRLFVEHEPAALDAAFEFGMVGSWLGRWLTGESALDPTQASFTGIFAADGSMRWLDELARRAGIRTSLLPRLLPSLSRCGEVLTAPAQRLGIPAGIPLVTGSADTPAAAFALGIGPQGPPLLTIGTTHVLTSCSTSRSLSSPALQRADVRTGRWLINGVTNGGDALAAATRILGFESVDALIAEAMQVTPELAEDAPIFLPHLMPERGPLWLAEPCGSLQGLTVKTTRAATAWSVLEGVAFADRLVAEACVPRARTELYLAGVFRGHEAVPQLLADALGCTIRLVDDGDLSAIGAAAMAAETIAGAPISAPPARTIPPRPEWAGLLERRWESFRRHWERSTGQRVSVLGSRP